MNYHWKLHITSGLVIAFLFLCGIYLLGVNTGLRAVIKDSSQKYADLQSVTLVALTQVNATADETIRGIHRNTLYAENLNKNLSGGLSPEAHTMVRAKEDRKRRRKKRTKNTNNAIGGP